jgi:hypothetical protein
MLNTIPIKIPKTFITETKKSTLKFIWKHKRLQIVKAILSKNSNPTSITISNFKLYYRTIAIKTAWYWHRNRYEDQWNKIEDPDMKPHSYTHLIFDKSAKEIQPLQKVLSACRKLKLDPCLSSCTSINSKWIEDLNINSQNLQVSTGKSKEFTGSNRYR